MNFMYYADLEVNYADGSFGAKRFQGWSMENAQKQADDKLREMISTSKFAKQMDADKAFEVVSHKITAGRIDV